MFKKWSIVLCWSLLCLSAQSQTNPLDTLSKSEREALMIDTTIDYDELFTDFETFMDSILSPRSYFMPSLSISRGYFNFTSKNTELLDPVSKTTYTPMMTWYHKSGIGLSATGYLINDGQHPNLYQWSLTPSFDYLTNHDLATGLSYSRYFSKDSLPFYTSPLKNELYGYFTWRKWWVRPMVALSYGWGSRSDYEEREELIQSLRLRPRGYTYINTKESISDFTLLTSIRHDFYWLNLFGYNDHARVTPQINFTSGTQKFGFNRKSDTYGTTVLTSTNVLYSSENTYLDDQLEFQPLSLSFYLRTEYSIGKFFIQPQFMLDYYFPAETKNFSTLFSVNMGIVF